MPILHQKDREAVQQRFDTSLKREVKIALYTQANTGLYIPGRECRYCGPTQELLEEISAISTKIRLDVIDFYKSPEKASEAGVNRIPALIIGADNGHNVKYYGFPSGFEFPVLLDTIIAASGHRSGLKLKTRRRLKELEEDVHIQVFVTPGCQYCPALARIVHAMAIESPRVSSDVIEIQEFPDLAGKYRVRGVPKTVINDRLEFTGAASEDELMGRVLQAVGVEAAGEDEHQAVSGQTTSII